MLYLTKRSDMDFSEWGERKGEPVKVEYTDGNTKTLPLCEQCKNEFLEGVLVREVKSTEAE